MERRLWKTRSDRSAPRGFSVINTNVAVTLAGLLVVAACGLGNSDGGRRDDRQPESSGVADVDAPSASPTPSAGVRLEQIPGDAPEDVPSALDNMWNSDLPLPLINPDEVLAAGPPPDGIPAIDEPRFERASEIDWIDDSEGVLALSVGEETRGYPMQVLMWHEIVNDTVSGTPVAVTYCPLCNSGVAFIREIDDRVFTFGTSGRLYLSNLVMYDRQTESLWPQLTGMASVGILVGKQLDGLPLIPVAWSDFRDAHPEAWVLSMETGYSRPYGFNPYTDYDNPGTPVLFDPGARDERLGFKDRVIAIAGARESIAVQRTAIAEAGVLEFTVDDRDLVAFHVGGQASSLDQSTLAAGQEIGSVAVFEARLGDEPLTFTADDERFVDDQTGTTWSILGDAIAGPRSGESLTSYPFTDTFWFAWIAFRPDTRVVPSPDAG